MRGTLLLLVAGATVLLAACSTAAADEPVEDAWTAPAGFAAQAFACDATWSCAGLSADFLQAPIYHPVGDAVTSVGYFARRGPWKRPGQAEVDPTAETAELLFDRAGASFGLQGDDDPVVRPVTGETTEVTVQGAPGVLTVVGDSTSVVWTTATGWGWKLTGPSSADVLGEADRLELTQPSAPHAGPTAGR